MRQPSCGPLGVLHHGHERGEDSRATHPQCETGANAEHTHLAVGHHANCHTRVVGADDDVQARVALGIPRLRPHDLRVMFARETHARGADLKAVQGLLGHSTPTMTMHYIPADISCDAGSGHAVGSRRQQGDGEGWAWEPPKRTEGTQ